MLISKVLVIAGGGGGGNNAGAGGGGGGYIEKEQFPLESGTYAITVGAGGRAAYVVSGSRYRGENGSNSVLSNLIAIGGGGGGPGGSAGSNDGSAGGSGGGSSAYNSSQTGGVGVSYQGYSGANTVSSGNALVAGGGGGRGGVAPNLNFSSGSHGGLGGVGYASSITGSSVMRAGGGSGTYQASAADGGGGASGAAGTANTGGGGGGNGAGGSGIVIISYETNGDFECTGGTITYSGGNTIHTFTSSGSFVVSGIKKVAAILKASIKKVASIGFNNNEIEETSLLDDADLKAYYRFNTGDQETDNTDRNNDLDLIGTPNEVDGIFDKGMNFNGAEGGAIGSSSPTAYYKFEGNSNATYGGVNGSDTNISYSTSYGKYGQGALFNGSSSKIVLNNTVMQVTTGDFTVGFSIKTSQTDANYRNIICKGGDGYNGWNLKIRSGSLILGWDDGTNANTSMTGGGGLADGEWHNVCIIADRNVGAYLYIDGEYKGLSTFITARTGSLSNSLNTTIGVWSNGTQWFFDGCIDNVVFWGLAIPTYMGQQMTRTEYFDDWRPTGEFTIAAWLKTTDTAANYYLQAYSDNPTRGGWLMGITNGGIVQMFMAAGDTHATQYDSLNGTIAVNDGEWHHVVGVYDGSYMRIYVDGKQDTSLAWTVDPVYENTTYRRMGCFTASGSITSYYEGVLDDVAIFHRALTATEIMSLKNNTERIVEVANV